jgi:putative membrane protein
MTTRHATRFTIGAAALMLAAGTFGADDQTFLKDVIQSNIGEVGLAKLAMAKSQNEDLKEYAETLNEDHTKSMEQAIEIAQSMGITPPTDPKPEGLRAHDMMANASGREFDHHFLSHMIESHTKAIAEFGAHAKTGLADSKVKEFAEDTLPTLEEHLEAAKALQTE